MLPKDKKRLERERSIAKVKAGSDYSQYEKTVRAVKADIASRIASQRRSDVQESWAGQCLMRHHQITSDKHRRIQTQNEHKTYEVLPTISAKFFFDALEKYERKRASSSASFTSLTHRKFVFARVHAT